MCGNPANLPVNLNSPSGPLFRTRTMNQWDPGRAIRQPRGHRFWQKPVAKKPEVCIKPRRRAGRPHPKAPETNAERPSFSPAVGKRS